MFGYVRPLKAELKCKEFDYFKSVYCGLCHTLGERYGLPARFVLNYDLTFFTVVLLALQGGTASEKRTCLASPLRAKCVACGSEVLDLSADLTVLLYYHKLTDTVEDAAWLKSIGVRLLRRWLRARFRKAERFRPVLSKTIEDSLSRLRAMEEARCDSIDRVADPFAQILSGAVVEAGLDERTTRVLAEMFYQIGRWIYIIDACDDFPQDQQTHGYNPIALRYGLAGEHLDEAVKKEIRITLSHSLAAAASAFELLEFGESEGLVANIIYQGLTAVTTQVLAGTWQKRSKSDDRPL